MVEALLAAVLLLTALSLVNLVLILGVVRRLREHDSRLATAAFGSPELMSAAVGDRVRDLTTQSVDGSPVTIGSGEPALIGFFSPSCDSCHDRVDEFRTAAAAGPGSAVAVVVRDGGDADGFVAELAGLTVVLEDLGGPVTGAFGVRAFPAFARLDAEGTLLARDFVLPPLQPV